MDVNTSNTINLGKAADVTGGAGVIRYERKTSDTDINNALVLGIGASTNSYLTLRKFLNLKL